MRKRGKDLSFLVTTLFFLVFSACTGYVNRPYQGEQKDFIEKIALFPIDNFSDNRDVLTDVMPELNGQLRKDGFEVVDENVLNEFLLKYRIRDTGYISKDIAMKTGKDLKAGAILVGSVISFSTEINPQFGIIARLIDSSSGTILWADYASGTGDDFSGILGLGRLQTVDSLVPEIADRLFISFSAAPPYKMKESTYRIAVMPFQNKSKYRKAGAIVAQMFISELFRSQRFEPVEYGDIRKSIVDLRVRYRGELDYKNIKAMSESLGVDGIIVGTVESYSDGVDTNSPPEVSITARLLDAHKNRILWYNHYALNGDDGISILDFGKIRSVDKVAYKTVSELVKTMEAANWYYNSQ
jgi:TolB-like protein